MAQISISDLSFSYDGSPDLIFDHLSLLLDTDWRLGLVGRNGRGKTTLLRLLCGALDGRGRISSPVMFDYFPFSVPEPEREALEVLTALDPALEEWQIYKELAALEVDAGVLFRPFATLSPGEQAKLLLASLFLRRGHFLLIDEPTNHLDTEGRQAVSAYLRRKKGFLLVSHDRTFLDGCVDHILAFQRQGLEVRQGSFSTWWENKARQDQFEQAEQDRLKREIAHLESAARRTANWSDRAEAAKKGTRIAGLRPDRGYLGHKAAKVMKRAKSAARRQEAALEEKSGLLCNLEQADPLKLRPLSHPKKRLMEAVRVTVDYGDGPICAPVSFTVEQGERVALVGHNGAGKSSFLKLAAGGDIPHTGLFTLASGLVLSVVPQDTSFLSGSAIRFAQESGIDETLYLTLLRKLDFSRSQLETDLSLCSAGQKKKALLARSLCQQAHLYLWDEPLNYIDLFSRMQLEDLIQKVQPTMLFVEHDQRFLHQVATKTVALHTA
ncbi:MAG: ABC-F family ATP-binding cassette domain-containing protein [Oscillospiraceae bacterium]|nr:ABC-F family ATP-binding cassette domain-containing protein [Oscillospiraceae bacterium]